MIFGPSVASSVLPLRFVSIPVITIRPLIVRVCCLGAWNIVRFQGLQIIVFTAFPCLHSRHVIPSFRQIIALRDPRQFRFQFISLFQDDAQHAVQLTSSAWVHVGKRLVQLGLGLFQNYFLLLYILENIDRFILPNIAVIFVRVIVVLMADELDLGLIFVLELIVLVFVVLVFAVLEFVVVELIVLEFVLILVVVESVRKDKI